MRGFPCTTRRTYRRKERRREEDPCEELSGEGDVVDSLRSGAVRRMITWVEKVNGAKRLSFWNEG